MGVEQIFVIRHGEYSEKTGRLADSGKTQIIDSAQTINRLISEKDPFHITYFSGSDIRCAESAIVLMDVIETDRYSLIYSSSLFSEEKVGLGYAEIKKAYRKRAIVVGSAPFVKNFPKILLSDEIGKIPGNNVAEFDAEKESKIGYGKGFYIDITKGRWERI